MRRAARILAFVTLSLGWTEPAWAGDPERPPVQRPSKPVAEAVEVELAPEPAPEPAIEFATAPIAEPPPPAPEVGLPSYATPVLADSDVAVMREVPRDGRGRLTVGTFAVLGGATLFAGSIALAVDGYEASVWGSTLALGAVATVTGGLLLHGGRRRLHAYRGWEAAQADVVPRQGHGLVASGGVLLVAGAAAGMSGTIGWMFDSMGTWFTDREPSPIPPAVFGLGLGSLAAGTALMVMGMQRHKRFQAWRHDGPLERMQLVPGVAPLAGGAQIGVSGRF
jgi:hypothetical protein